jgi:hypothetical protein
MDYNSSLSTRGARHPTSPQKKERIRYINHAFEEKYGRAGSTEELREFSKTLPPTPKVKLHRNWPKRGEVWSFLTVNDVSVTKAARFLGRNECSMRKLLSKVNKPGDRIDIPLVRLTKAIKTGVLQQGPNAYTGLGDEALRDYAIEIFKVPCLVLSTCHNDEELAKHMLEDQEDWIRYFIKEVTGVGKLNL